MSSLTNSFIGFSGCCAFFLFFAVIPIVTMSDITISNANLFINGHYYGCKYSVFTAILATLQQKLSLFRYSVVLAEADERRNGSR